MSQPSSDDHLRRTTRAQSEDLHIHLPTRPEIYHETRSINDSFDKLLQTIHTLLHNPRWTYSIYNPVLAPIHDSSHATNDEMRATIAILDSMIRDFHVDSEECENQRLVRELASYRIAQAEIVPLLETLMVGRGRVHNSRAQVRRWRADMESHLALEPKPLRPDEEEVLGEIRLLFDKTEEAWEGVLRRSDVAEGVVLSLRLHVMEIHLQRLQSMRKG